MMVWNCNPAGLNLTAFTRRPVGKIIVIDTDCLRAARGMTSVWGPTLRLPPAGPIVCVVES